MKNKKFSALLLVMAMLLALVVPAQAAEPVAVRRGLISTGEINATAISMYDKYVGEAAYQQSQPSATYTFSDTETAGGQGVWNDSCPSWAGNPSNVFDGKLGETTANGLGGADDTGWQSSWNGGHAQTTEIVYDAEITASGLDIWTSTLPLSNIAIYVKNGSGEWESVSNLATEHETITTTTAVTRNLYRTTFDETTNDEWKIVFTNGGSSRQICEIYFLGELTVVQGIRTGLISTGEISAMTAQAYNLAGESAYQLSKPSATYTFADTQAAGQPQWNASTAPDAWDGKVGLTTANGKGSTAETGCQVGWNGATVTAEIAYTSAVTAKGIDVWTAGVDNNGTNPLTLTAIKVYTKNDGGEWVQVETSAMSLKELTVREGVYRRLYRVTFGEATDTDWKVEISHGGTSRIICDVFFLGEYTEMGEPATTIEVISGNPLNEAAIAKYADLGTTVTVSETNASITWNDADLDSAGRVASLSNGNIANGWTGEDSTSKFNESNKVDMYVDFEAPATFNRIDLWTFEKGDQLRTKSFDVYVSNDKVNWLFQGSVVNENEEDEPANHQLELISFHCQPTTAQYIWIRSHDKIYQQIITELVVFGEELEIQLSGTAPKFVTLDGADYVADAEESAYEGFKAVTKFTGGEGTLVVGWYDSEMKELKKVYTATGTGDVFVNITADEEITFLDSGSDVMKAFVFGNMAEVQLLSNTVAELNILGE